MTENNKTEILKHTFYFIFIYIFIYFYVFLYFKTYFLSYFWSTYSRMKRGKMNITMREMEYIQKNQMAHLEMKIIVIKI